MKQLSYRLASIAAPITLDEKSRTVDAVVVTEQPTMVFDWDRLEVVREVLLMDGVKLPSNKQVPFLDSHSRFGAGSVFGSARDLAVDGNKITAKIYFSSMASDAWVKVSEGHITDISAGYRIDEKRWIAEGESYKYNDRIYEGPLSLVTKWSLKEVSLVPIGADEFAKIRSDIIQSRIMVRDDRKEVQKMDKEKQVGKDTVMEKTAEEARPDEEIRAEERARCMEIRAMCEAFGVPDEDATKWIGSGISIDKARELVLDHVAGKMQAVGYREPAKIIVDARDKFRAAATNALLYRAGIVRDPVYCESDLAGMTLSEMARTALATVGEKVPSSRAEMVGRAFTVSDFPYVLADTAQKSLFAGFDTESATWSDWVAQGLVSDFKTYTSVHASEADDLALVPEDSPYAYETRTEVKEEYSVDTYGKIYAITRQAIINDDLGALTNVPMAHGEAAARKVADVVYSVLTTNAAMGDGVALFHSSHGNLGSAGALSSTTLAEAIKLMRLQKGIGSKSRLNINPTFFIAPVALEGSSEVFFGSQYLDVTSGSAINNPYGGSRFIRIYDPRLDDASATAWYLAGPKGKTITVFFLDGQNRPRLESRNGWTVDGVEYKVSIDCGAKAMSWKGLVKNAGA